MNGSRIDHLSEALPGVRVEMVEEVYEVYEVYEVEEVGAEITVLRD
jgi:hypothetical protein